MAIPKKLSKEQIEINKNKQKLLNSAGYNIKVDGSWGPWQEQQYNKIMSRGRMFADKRAEQQAAQAKWENDHHKAIAGYYFSDTPTLPNLAKGAYHWLMGNVFSEPENTQYYMTTHGVMSDFTGGPAGTAKTATKLPTTAKEFVQAVKNFRVPTLRTLFGQPTKDINVGRLSSTTRSQAPVITTVAEGSNQVPIRVATVNLSHNPVVTEAPEAVQSASRMPAVYGSTTRTVAERVGQRPTEVVNTTTGAKTFQKGYNKGLKEGQAQKQGLDDALKASQSQIIERDQQIQQLTEELKLLKEGKVAQETAQAAKPTIRVVEPAVSQTSPAQAAQAAQASAPAAQVTTSAANSGRGFWGNLQRALWETKDNNFGKYYIGKNILRGVGYSFIIPPLSGAIYEHVPEAFRSYGDYAKKSFNFGRGKPAAQDSTRVDSTGRDSSQTAQTRDSSQVQQQTQHVIPQAENGVIQAEDMSAVIDSILGI